MAHFYMSADNSRGGEVTAANGSYAHLRGWNAGVNVRAYQDNEKRDAFDVTMTSGSNTGDSGVFLGTVHDMPDGPCFTPAEPAIRDGYVTIQVRVPTADPAVIADITEGAQRYVDLTYGVTA